MGRINVILFTALAVAGLSAAQAEKLYKWVDSQGRISYHDQPPPEGAGYRVEEKNLKGEARIAPEKSQDVAAKFPVILYTAPQCASCDMARSYLDKRKVPFTEKMVEGDPGLQEELKKKSGSLSVPTITVGDKIMKGYLESLLEGELDAAGYPKMEAPESGKPEEKKEGASAS